MNRFHCPKCGEFQYRSTCKRYLLDSVERDEVVQCWMCDITDWRKGELSIKTLEERERFSATGTKQVVK